MRWPVLLLFSLLSATAHAQTPFDHFYDGKKINVLVSSAAGGGYDQYARLLARHLPDHIKGHPIIIIQNMPGAEGVKVATSIYQNMPQDGTYIGALSKSIALSKLYSPLTAPLLYDPLSFQWIGSLKHDNTLLVVNAKSPIHSAQDLRSHDMSVSSQAINSPNSIQARLLNEFYGAHLKPIEGYEGSTAGMLAVERFETDGHIGGASPPIKERIKKWIAAGTGRVIVQLGMERDPDFSDVPTILELIDDAASRRIFALTFSEQDIGTPFVFGPKVPSELYDVMMRAFDETTTDPSFRADAQSINAPLYILSGHEITDMLHRAYATPQEDVARLRAIVNPQSP
jgi:tripartite-type tricarboxylate transporter receptor subunit TctC